MKRDSVLQVVLSHFLGHGGMEVGADYPWGHAIDANVVVGKFIGQGPGPAFRPPLEHNAWRRWRYQHPPQSAGIFGLMLLCYDAYLGPSRLSGVRQWRRQLPLRPAQSPPRPRSPWCHRLPKRRTFI